MKPDGTKDAYEILKDQTAEMAMRIKAREIESKHYEEKIHVRCVVCKRIYVSKIPKGGDGTILYPRLHYEKLLFPVSIIEVMNKVSGKSYCEGSFQEGIVVD